MKRVIVAIIYLFLLSTTPLFSQDKSKLTTNRKSVFKKSSFGHDGSKDSKGLPPNPGGGGGDPIPVPYGYFLLVAGLSTYMFVEFRKNIKQKV